MKNYNIQVFEKLVNIGNNQTGDMPVISFTPENTHSSL